MCYLDATSGIIRKTFDYIVIGLGLAGAALALGLHQRKRRILVIDSPAENTSSRIAAGIFNPVTGRKMTKTWLADKLFPALHTHYRAAEALTGNTFFHPMPIYRPFVSIEEQNEWMGKSSDSALKPFIRHVLSAPAIPGVRDPVGGLLLDQCGYLDTKSYVDSVRDLLIRERSYEETWLNDDDLIPGDESVRCGSAEARHVVFCHGVHTGRWFGWLPVRPLKGETIDVSLALQGERIVNRGVYLVPGTTGWRVGATYSYGDHNHDVTEESKSALISGLAELINLPFAVTGQRWGFRPTTPDRRPLLGRHPGHARIWTFNGLGTKGVSLAPYFSDVLIQAMENGVPLNKEVDIERYKSLYWTSLT